MSTLEIQIHEKVKIIEDFKTFLLQSVSVRICNAS